MNLYNRLDKIKNIKKLNKIMLTGGSGQIGRSLLPSLNYVYGEENILTTDILPMENIKNFKNLDCLDSKEFKNIFNDFKPDMLLHLPAILSGKGELNTDLTLKINIDTFNTALKLCYENNTKLFSPSSIAVYGNNINKNQTKDNSAQFPNTIYGVTKVYLELMGQYYREKKNLDFRCVRYPGVLSSKKPGKGTTDFATEIFYKYIKNEKYSCYLSEDTELPFIFEEDLIIETLKFIETDLNKLKNQAYSLQSYSLTPKKLYNYLKDINPEFKIEYKSDFRQEIADIWPNKMSNINAKKDWDFNPLWKEKDSILKILEELKNEN